MLIQGQVGEPSGMTIQPGTTPNLRLGQQADQIVSELQGRFYENTYRGRMFSGFGVSTTATATHAIATLGATCTPVIGVWNPTTSTVNMAILQVGIQIALAPNSAGVNAGFSWAASTGNSAISTGSNPINMKTLAAAGSQGKYYGMATALTGLTTTLVVMGMLDGPSLVVAQGATGTPMITPMVVTNFDGALIVPPGGVFAALGITSNTTMNYISRILWAEVPI
jgi:hypothetical protein